MDEQRLIMRLRAGDAAAEREFYDAHVDRVYRLAYRLSGDAELARELTQDAFVRAFDRLHQFRQESALSTWLYAVALSVIRTGTRRLRRPRPREVELGEAPEPSVAPPAADPYLRDRVAAAIDALPEIYRTVFIMYELEGYTHDEIAAALDMAPGTSKARLSRARGRLREALAEVKREMAR